jgi:hypothetical protein
MRRLFPTVLKVSVSNELMKTNFAAILFLLMSFSCKDDSISNCISGIVVGYEQCSNAVLIKVNNSHPIGGSMHYYDNTPYDNVVRAPGLRDQYGKGKIYFSYREYDRDNDQDLFQAGSPCLAIYAPFDVPTVVITAYSMQGCNE